MNNIKRNILLNPGPSTTTDTVKMAQVVPDICPREKEFASLMKGLREDLVKIVHGDTDEYTAVLFTGSGTINIDVCMNSLLPEGKKVLVINNGAYSTRAVEICQYYGLDYINLEFPIDELPDLSVVEQTLKSNPDIALVHTTHNETGTGILNPIRQIGAIAHKYGAVFSVDTTSTYAMRPIDVNKDNIDFCMASAQKGLMAMTGLSYIVGKREIIEKSKDYPKRSYYCNLYMQYDFFEKTGQMHFTPPVQTIYSVIQALKEYWAEGEEAKWARHTRVFEAIHMVSILFESATMSAGIVAEKKRVWRDFGSSGSRRLMSATNPMSSIRSASSSTKCVIASSSTNLCPIRSCRRPGVAIRISTPPRSASTCGPCFTPPKIVRCFRPTYFP